MTRTQTRAFVRAHHRHGRRPPASEILRAGLEHDGELVAVAIAGIPARELMDGYTIEISRVCVRAGVDPTVNACSRLYGALCRAAAALGWRRAISYTLDHEPGTSLRAAGFQPVDDVPARSRAVKLGGRPRYQENLLGEVVELETAKVRWERRLG